jgi:hypothetical protein
MLQILVILILYRVHTSKVPENCIIEHYLLTRNVRYTVHWILKLECCFFVLQNLTSSSTENLLL